MSLSGKKTFIQYSQILALKNSQFRLCCVETISVAAPLNFFFFRLIAVAFLVATPTLAAPEIRFLGLPVTFLSAPEDIAVWQSRPTLIQFWASWCISCGGLMVEMETLKKQHPTLLYMAVNTDAKLATALDAQQLLHKATSSAPQLFDIDGAWASRFSVVTVPTIVLLNADGQEIFRHIGHLDAATRLKLITALDSPTNFRPTRNS